MSKIVRCLISIACIYPLIAFAHFQGPVDIRTVVYSDDTSVDITIGNASSFDQYFQLYVDDVALGDKFLIKSETKKIRPIIFSMKKDSTRVFEVCSISLPSSQSNIWTRICTLVQLFYPYSYLQSLK